MARYNTVLCWQILCLLTTSIIIAVLSGVNTLMEYIISGPILSVRRAAVYQITTTLRCCCCCCRPMYPLCIERGRRRRWWGTLRVKSNIQHRDEIKDKKNITKLLLLLLFFFLFLFSLSLSALWSKFGANQYSRPHSASLLLVCMYIQRRGRE